MDVLLLHAKAADWSAVIDYLTQHDQNNENDNNSKTTDDATNHPDSTLAPARGGCRLERDLVSGTSIAHLAAAADRVDILELLHRRGVDFRRQVNFCNRTPMEEARRAGATAALQYLLETAYSPAERLFYGDDSFAALVATFTKHPAAVNERLAVYNSLTWIAICTEELRVREVVWLALHGADLTLTDDMQNTLLHLVDVSSFERLTPRPHAEEPPPSPAEAAELARIDNILQQMFPPDHFVGGGAALRCLQCLAFLASSNKVDVNAVNNEGTTAAALIAERAETNPVLAWVALRLLKNFGADLTIRNNDGCDVAMLLASSCGDGPWLQWTLSEGGCDANAVDEQGRAIEDFVVLSSSNAAPRRRFAAGTP